MRVHLFVQKINNKFIKNINKIIITFCILKYNYNNKFYRNFYEIYIKILYNIQEISYLYRFFKSLNI